MVAFRISIIITLVLLAASVASANQIDAKTLTADSLYTTIPASLPGASVTDSVTVADLAETIDTIPSPDTVATKPSGFKGKFKEFMGGSWFNLDAIAAKGKFPKFCVDVYRWGDRTFNSYDTTYVVGTGYKWNLKARNDNWIDGYTFDVDNELLKSRVRMNSEVSSTIGLSLTFMAVTVGYDINISRLFYGRQTGRKMFNFNFCCSRLAFDFRLSKNNSFAKIRTSVEQYDALTDIYFKGVENKSTTINAYYFFNNYKYSQAAAYNYSKIQRRSAGSMIAGFSINLQDLYMDFSEVIQQYPDLSSLRDFKLKSNNYTFIIGYGYNWVPNKHWVFNATLAPSVGWRYGEQSFSEEAKSHYSFSFNTFAKMAATYNLKRWFISLFGQLELALYAEKRYTFVSTIGNLTLLGGFRF